jgi:filamentous hemagglutinin family protein
MQPYLKYFIGYVLMMSALDGYTEIILDGSLGPRGPLKGPHFTIDAQLGQQVGHNLFHSFDTFNLYENEHATFSGPTHINAIINRVTGGQQSHIDGTLRSMLPEADFYLLNPAGILMGKHATLDISGSVHFSTATVLRLGEAGQFAADTAQKSILSTAAPTAFGFLDDSPAEISLQGSQLSVQTGKTLSLTGGDIHLQESQLQAAEGHLKLTSTGKAKAVLIASDNLETPPEGHLTMKETRLDVSGAGAGSVFIQAGQLKLDNSEVLSETRGTKKAGTVHILAKEVELLNGTQLSSNTLSTGQGGEIILNVTGTITLTGLNQAGSSSKIVAETKGIQKGAGDAGTIHINTKNLHLSQQARIRSNTSGRGNAGAIRIHATDTVASAENSAILANSVPETQENFVGNAGTIIIEGEKLRLTGGAQIASATVGNGQGGNIVIHVRDKATLTGIGEGGFPSGISGFTGSSQPKAGRAGNIVLEAKHLEVTEGARISNSGIGTGQGGAIEIKASEGVLLAGVGGIYANTNDGKGGTISVKAHHLTFTDGVQIGSSTFGQGDAGEIRVKVADTVSIQGVADDGFSSGISVTAEGQQATAGDAGRIVLTAKQLYLKQGGRIESFTTGTGDGGEIHIDVKNNMRISGEDKGVASAITGESFSKQQPAGKAGIVAIKTPILILTDKGKISTSAEAGQAGNMTITVNTLQLTQEGLISSASRGAGDAGNITLSANQIHLKDAHLSTQAAQAEGGNILIYIPELVDLFDSTITTNVKGGTGGGGNIHIKSPLFVVLDKSHIVASAVGGDGGNITIAAKNLVKAPSSTLNASSQLGIDGTIVIAAPEIDMSNKVIILPTEILDAATFFKMGCANGTRGEKSRFVMTGHGKFPIAPEDLKPSVAAEDAAYTSSVLTAIECAP